jgi:predicted nuclease with TOPRIM domain
MTALRARRPLFFSLLSLFLVVLVALPSAARAGGDDFEYGLALAELGRKFGDKAYFKYARRVFDNVIKSPNASEADKDLCKYGLAKMKRDEAMGATQNEKLKYAEIVKLFNDAVDDMASFVDRNPKHEKAPEAKLAVGTTRLAFVEWAREDLLPDPEAMADLGTNMKDVQTDATSMVRDAIRYFDGLRKGHDQINASEMSQLAQYYWVLCQYYLALVYEKGSTEAKEAFQDARTHLDDFISLNDGQLLAIYAQDIFGLTYWELAKIAALDGKEDEQIGYYRRAIEWFETCIESPNDGPEWERVITNGYYHLGKVCLEAGRLGTENFHRVGAAFLQTMEERYPTAWRQDNGIRALIEWSKIEAQRDRTSDAVDIAKRAGDYAKKLGKSYLEALANRTLRKILSGGGRRGGGVINADPGVLKRVADDFFLEKKWLEAISAYQRVIAAVPRNRETVQTFLLPTWERVAAAYKEAGDLLAAALAYESIHEIWIDGLVPKTGEEDDPNMINLGNKRRLAMSAWEELFKLTGSPVYRDRQKEIRDSFPEDYPGHPSAQAGQWNSAREQFGEADRLKRENDSKWRAKLKSAEEGFREVAKDMRSPKQDAAWVYLIHCNYIRENWKGMLNSYDDAVSFWNSPAAKDQAKQFPTVATRRRGEMGKAIFWKSEAYYRLATAAEEAKQDAEAKKNWQAVIKTLEGWHVDYEGLKGKGPYYSGTLGHLVLAHIGLGDIPGADKPYRKLLADDPAYRRLPKITFALAKHFNDQARVIDEDRKEARARLHGTEADPTSGVRTRLRHTTANEWRTVEYLGNRRARKVKQEDLVRVYEEKREKGLQQNIKDEDYEAAKKEIPELTKEIAELTDKANRLRAEREALEKEAAELDQKIRDLAQQLYDPIVKAANYFKDWDDALVRSGQKRMANNVAIFADLFYKAARLRPKETENWAKAQSLYEDYLKLPDAEADVKHEALGRLGTIYARLAEAADEGSDERAALVQKALDRLQGSVAKLPENNDLIVGLLSGDVVVVPYGAPGQPKHRFPLPRVKTVEEFRKAVNGLGTTTPIPSFETDVENKRYANAIRDFKLHVNEQMRPAEIERTVRGFAIAGFDVPFYREHAESGDEFRMALAWIYSESGQLEHMTKAINLTGSLVQGRYAAEENSELWWEAQVVKLKAIINGAELETKTGGPPKPTAAEWVDRASKMIRGLNTSSPELGDDVRPETRPQLKKLLERLEGLRTRVGLKPLDLILEPLPPVQPVEQPGANGKGAPK